MNAHNAPDKPGFVSTKRTVNARLKETVGVNAEKIRCPFAAFGAIIVNHTADEVVCEGANFRTGDPTSMSTICNRGLH